MLGPSDDIVRKAVEVSAIAFLITDMRADDHPIVFANAAFERLSGYRRSEVIGRNCRFLQGDDVDQPGREIVRRALARCTPCRVTLRNYRKDGTAFLNELRLSPVRDDAGAVTHYVGCQTPVPYPVLATLRSESIARIGLLTAREREVLSLIVHGQSTKAVARDLAISPRTAEKHRQNLFRKMRADSVAALVTTAIAADHGNGH